MLKKFKILLLLIVLTAAGIVLVLSIWLYGSYKNRQELFLGTAERTLFNVLQNYYQHELSAEWKKEQSGSLDSNKRYSSFMNLVGSVYPEVDLNKLRLALDTSEFRKSHARKMKQGTRVKDSPDQLMPWYMLERIDFNATLLDTLGGRLETALARNKIKARFELNLEEIKHEDFDLYYGRKARKENLLTRPILVNPDADQYLVAKFQQPYSYYMAKMAGQLLFSVLLLGALLGTFVYLLRTIKKQNELALLRKSFVNNMTHELKTPVATVMAAVEAIQHFVAKDDRVKMDKYLEISRHELEHLHQMIERVLQLNIEDSVGIVLAKESFDLVPVLEANLEAAVLSAKKKIVITREIPMTSLFIVADESHMRNVIANLLDNAIKYSEEPVQLRISLQVSEQGLILAIGDKGKGIPQKYQKHIFDMFYRVPEGNLHAVKGFGLGLAYVKQLVEQHNGTIKVDSVLGAGSVFTVFLPLNEAKVIA